MSVTLDDVSSPILLLITRMLLIYFRLTKLDALEMIVQYLGVDPGDVQQEINDTRGCHAKFKFQERLYICHLDVKVGVGGDDVQVVHHRVCALRSYLLYLVDTSIFVDKSAYYIDVVYLIHFINLERIHKYNWGPHVWFTSTPS